MRPPRKMLSYATKTRQVALSVRAQGVMMMASESGRSFVMDSKRFTLLTALLLFTCLLGPAQLPWAQEAAAQPAQQRKTSTPYAGDLSIFDSPGRDERLHTRTLPSEVKMPCLSSRRHRIEKKISTWFSHEA